MGQGSGRKWVGRAAVGVFLAVAAAGTWAGFHWPELRVKYAAHRLKSAATDEERAQWADALATHDDAGLPTLVELIRTGDAPTRAASAAALDRHLNGLPDGDPQALALCGQLLDAFAGCDDPGREAVLGLLPAIQKRSGVAHAEKCREVIAAGLKLPGVQSRLSAIRAAMHPTAGMRAELLPLLTAAEPEVRRAALFAVGPATDGDPVVGDEELFRWLHDPDAGVRKGCHEALVSRGRTEPEIALGRRLVHPDPAERLRLLLDLRYDDDVPDPEPWLERLSRDPDPGVRAGAGRVAVELARERQLPVAPWVARLAEADPSPTVRRVAGFYHSQLAARPDGGVVPASGP